MMILNSPLLSRKSVWLVFFTLLITAAVYKEIAYAQVRKELVPYLKNNRISLTDLHPAFEKVFDADLYQSQIILIGERHGIVYSYDALWSLFKQLKVKTNFKYYLLETPFYWEMYLNKYMESGEERYLKKAFGEARGTFYGNQSFFEYYRKVYAYNQTLPAQDRIHFISIDVEHQYKYTHVLLSDMLTHYLEKTKDSCSFIKLFYKLDPERNGNYEDAYFQYSQALAKDSALLKKKLTLQFDTISYLIRNVNYKFSAGADKKDLARDSLMYENFKTRCKEFNLQQGKAFGFMGIDHCYQDGDTKKRYFASFIPKSEYRTSSLIMLYSNCSTLVPTFYIPKPFRFLWGNAPYVKTTMRSNDKFLEYQKFIGILKEAAPSNLTLFKLGNSGSPFTKHHLFVDDLHSEKPTTNYMQYIVLVRNSPAANPL